MALSWSLLSLPPPAYHKNLMGQALYGRATYRDILTDLWQNVRCTAKQKQAMLASNPWRDSGVVELSKMFNLKGKSFSRASHFFIQLYPMPCKRLVSRVAVL